MEWGILPGGTKVNISYWVNIIVYTYYIHTVELFHSNVPALHMFEIHLYLFELLSYSHNRNKNKWQLIQLLFHYSRQIHSLFPERSKKHHMRQSLGYYHLFYHLTDWGHRL